MKTLYIIRGIPGSGKSTLANKIKTDHSAHFEADNFFMDGNEYRFDRTKLKDAHAWCQSLTKSAMIGGVAEIIVSNTFTQRWEIDPYIKMANEHDYSVHEIVCNGNFQSVHNVPQDAINKMRDRWEN